MPSSRSASKTLVNVPMPNDILARLVQETIRQQTLPACDRMNPDLSVSNINRVSVLCTILNEVLPPLERAGRKEPAKSILQRIRLLRKRLTAAG